MIPRLLTPKSTYTTDYQEAIEFSRKQASILWTPEEIDVEKDLHGLKTNFNEAEYHGVISTLKLFTLYELQVGSEYWMDYICKVFPRPDIQRMATTFSFVEIGVHSPFYSKINEVLGIDTDEFYNSYLEDEVLKNRMNWIGKRVSKRDSTMEILKSVGIFSMIEGAILYSSFAFLKHFNNNGGNKLIAINSGINYSVNDECMVPETEVLTTNGWVRFDMLSGTEKVAAYNKDTKEIHFEVPSRIVKKWYEGDLINFSGTVSQIVTPNHRMLVDSVFSEGTKFKLAKDTKYHCYNYLPLSGYLKGDDKLSDIERFLIATQADGSISKRYTGVLSGTRPIRFSFSKTRKIDRFLKLIDSLGYKLKEYPVSPGHGNVNPKRNFSVSVPVNDIDWDTVKTFEWVKLDKSKEWCEDFLEELSHWDGSLTKSEGYIEYSSVIKHNTDKVQAIAALCGRVANYDLRVDNRSDNYRDVNRLGIVPIDKRNGTNIKKSLIPYSGEVYCLSVSTEAFVIRHNNKVSITGNCLHSQAGAWLFKTLLKEVVDLDKDFNTDILIDDLYLTADIIYEHESIIIDKIFEKGSMEGITSSQLKAFVQSRLDECLVQLGLNARYLPEYNPIAKWFYKDIGGSVLHDFFVSHGSSYNRSWDKSKFSWS